MPQARLVPLSILPSGASGRIALVTPDVSGRVERLAAMGVSAGAGVLLLQTCPGIVLQCNQQRVALDRRAAAGIVVEVRDR
jgi:Fe2+ transport system protein FeoA